MTDRQAIASNRASGASIHAPGARDHAFGAGEAARTNLRGEPTRFVGRERAVEAVVHHLQGGARLVTLVGAPGTGKTRQAREVGHRYLSGFEARSAWFCDLSEARRSEANGPEEIERIVAHTLGVMLPSNEKAGEKSAAARREKPHVFQARLEAALQNRDEMLLILDNAEHVVGAVGAAVARWLSIAPSLQILVTSRQRLGLGEERCFEVGPLEEAEAVALFEDRARRVRADFELTGAVREAVVELVGRLDGIALAIELAAARVNTLPPAEMLRRLSLQLHSGATRFRLLRDVSARSDARPTLEAAIEWSWNLLDRPEREALVQCAVFRGGFSLEAAEAVVVFGAAGADDGGARGEGGAPDEGDAPWVIDVIEALTEKSLLRSHDVGGEARFTIFESIREFALRQPGFEALRAGAEQRHTRYYLELGHRLARLVRGVAGASWLERLELERANLVAVVERDGAPEQTIEAILALDTLMRYVGPYQVHEALLDRAVELARGADLGGLLARLELARGQLAMLRGQGGEWLDEALEDLRDSQRLAALHGAHEVQGRALFFEAELERQRGNLQEARALHEAGLTHARAHGLGGLERVVLAHLAGCQVDLGHNDAARLLLERLQSIRPAENLYDECHLHKRVAYVQFYLRDFAEQARHNQRALELARQIGDRRQEGICLQGLGDSAFVRGDYDAARAHYEAALPIHHALGNRHHEGILRGNLGAAYHRDGELVQARRHYVESLEIHRQTGARPYEAVVLFALGALEFEEAHLERATHYVERARSHHRELQQRSDEAAMELCLSWFALERDAYDRAQEHVANAAAMLEPPHCGGWSQVARATAAAVEAVRGSGAARATGSADGPFALEGLGEVEANLVRLLEAFCAWVAYRPGADALVAQALAAVRGSASYRHSLFVRVLTLWLERRASRTPEGLAAISEPVLEPADAAAADDGPCLLVAADGRWFEWRGGPGEESTRVDLRRRRSIRLILEWLARRRGEEPGVGTDVYELFEVGWPGECVDPESAAERVYWAVRTLRKLGLEDVLVTTDEGYLLNPEIEVRCEE